jgi:hypothetical protein
MRKVIVLSAAFAVLTAGDAFANILNDAVGNWDVVAVRTIGKEKVRWFSGRERVAKLKDGTFKSAGSGKIKGLYATVMNRGSIPTEPRRVFPI